MLASRCSINWLSRPQKGQGRFQGWVLTGLAAPPCPCQLRIATCPTKQFRVASLRCRWRLSSQVHSRISRPGADSSWKHINKYSFYLGVRARSLTSSSLPQFFYARSLPHRLATLPPPFFPSHRYPNRKGGQFVCTLAPCSNTANSSFQPAGFRCATVYDVLPSTRPREQHIHFSRLLCETIQPWIPTSGKALSQLAVPASRCCPLCPSFPHQRSWATLATPVPARPAALRPSSYSTIIPTFIREVQSI